MTTLNKLIVSLQQPLGRDLAWCIFAPELIQHNHALNIKLTDERIHWLQQVDKTPQKLQAATASAKNLGRYVECLWAFFYQQDTQYELIAHNLPVRENKQTLGEFDFIVYDHQQQCHIHQEIAIKFYIHHGAPQTTTDMHHWYGPNSHDRLGLKWQKMRDSQSRLSQHPAARQLLANMGIKQIKPAISLKGYLFAPPDTATPPWLASGNQLYHSYRAHNYNGPAGPVIPLSKKQWLHRQHATATSQSVSQAIDSVNTAQRPQLFAVADDQEQAVEQQRFFILPQVWPGE